MGQLLAARTTTGAACPSENKRRWARKKSPQVRDLMAFDSVISLGYLGEGDWPGGKTKSKRPLTGARFAHAVALFGRGLRAACNANKIEPYPPTSTCIGVLV